MKKFLSYLAAVFIFCCASQVWAGDCYAPLRSNIQGHSQHYSGYQQGVFYRVGEQFRDEALLEYLARLQAVQAKYTAPAQQAASTPIASSDQTRDENLAKVVATGVVAALRQLDANDLGGGGVSSVGGGNSGGAGSSSPLGPTTYYPRSEALKVGEAPIVSAWREGERVLVSRCSACHGATSKIAGGLRLVDRLADGSLALSTEVTSDDLVLSAHRAKKSSTGGPRPMPPMEDGGVRMTAKEVELLEALSDWLTAQEEKVGEVQ